VSHDAPDLYDRVAEDKVLRRHLDVIKRLTGSAPESCPWRAMYSPLVIEVIDAMEHEEHGNLATANGADPPAVLMDAIGAYKRAMSVVRMEDQKLAHEKAKRQQQQPRR
jgi:hypothetical protein